MSGAFYAVPITAGGGGKTDLDSLAPGATDGSIIFADDTGLGEDNANLFWDRTNLELGIGTNTPDAKLHLTRAVESSGTPVETLEVVDAAHTGLDNAEYVSILFDLSSTVNFTGGGSPISDQRAVRILAPTYSADSSQVIQEAATLSISGSPTAGTNVTINESYALRVASGKSAFPEGGLNSPSITFGDTDSGFSGQANRVRIVTEGEAKFIVATTAINVDNIDSFEPVSVGVDLGQGQRWHHGFFNRLEVRPGNVDEDLPILLVEADDVASVQTGSAPFSLARFDLDRDSIQFNGNFFSTIATAFGVEIEPPDWWTSPGSMTITDAATLYVSGPPTARGGTTITNAYVFWVDDGVSRFDGDGSHVFQLPQDDTDPTSGGGGATGRIPITVNGATRYLAYYT